MSSFFFLIIENYSAHRTIGLVLNSEGDRKYALSHSLSHTSQSFLGWVRLAWPRIFLDSTPRNGFHLLKLLPSFSGEVSPEAEARKSPLSTCTKAFSHGVAPKRFVES